MIAKLIITSLFCVSSVFTYAQTRSCLMESFRAEKITIRAGFNLGGVTPTSIPQEIRSIENYSPILPFSLGVEMPFFQINEDWDLLTGINVKSSGMKAGAYAENFRGMINLENTPYQNVYGYFTGSVKTKIHNWYIEVPVTARYGLNEKFNLLGGLAYSQSVARSMEGGVQDAYIRLGNPTTQKLDVPNASFKVANIVRKFDIAAQLGAEYNINEILDVRGMVNYGFVNVLHAPTENQPVSMHNVFFNLTLGYDLPLSR